MPQLVKGGKHAFGWSRASETGQIIIPPDALIEYQLQESGKLILLPGSRTSGGFGLGFKAYLEKSSPGIALKAHPELWEFRVSEGQVTVYKGKSYCWVTLCNGGITVPPETLEKFGIKTGDMLLVIRGSGLAIGFAVRGPIVEEAKKHPGLKVF